MGENRKEVRHGTRMDGRIAFERGSEVRDCAIRDISENGARLTFAALDGIPDRFELLIVTTGELFQAVAKWRRGRQIGVHFVEKDEFMLWPTRPRVIIGDAGSPA